MFDRLLLYLFQVIRDRKRAVLAIVLAATAAAAGALWFIRYDSSIDVMLPPDPEITRSLATLRDSNLSDKIIISLGLTDPSKSKKELFFAADQLAAALTPPLFTRVISGFSPADMIEEFSVLRYGPQILNEEDYTALDRKISPESVNEQMRTIFRQSLRPESIFLSSLSRTDPLGIKLLIFGKLRALPASMGYDVAVEDGHFMSRDGLHTMLIVQTPVSMLDGQGSAAVVKAVQDRIGLLPPYVSAAMVSGHFHTVSNERVIKRDIKVASVIASAAFLLLFLLAFRDFRAIFIFLIPAAAVTWAIIIGTGLEGRLSYLVIGLGTAIAGISTDFGLLVYIALRSGVDTMRTVKVAKLLMIDAATTIFSFAALYFSVIRGYHQLASFSILCVVVSLLFALFVLPLVLRPRDTAASLPSGGDRLQKFHGWAGITIGIWVLSTVILLFFAFTVHFDSDLKKLDGSEPKVLADQQAFHDIWGGKSNQAIFVVQGKTYEEATEKNDLVYRDATRAVGQENFTSLSYFWPSEKVRKENSIHWDRFWKEGRERKLKGLLREISPQYGFSETAFTPFFQGLYEHDDRGKTADGMISKLHDRFVVLKDGGASILSFFPEEQQTVDALKPIAKKYPGTFIVSGREMSSAISRFSSREMKILAPIAVLLNILPAVFFFRNWKEAFIALVPVVTGVVWLIGIMAVFKLSFNIVNMIALIVMIGVIVDYGLGVTYEYRNNLRTGTVAAITLSAVTNVLGAGVLLLAKHPALFSTGLAMVICTVTGYVSAVIVIPSMCSVLERGIELKESKEDPDSVKVRI